MLARYLYTSAALFLGLSIFLSRGVVAQQLPIYSLQTQNSFVLNPAFAGLEDYIDLKISMRRQWIGIDGAPETYYLAFSFPFKPMNPFLSAKQSLGVYAWFDRAGPALQSEGSIAYAVHKQLDRHGVLAFGGTLGFHSFILSKADLIGQTDTPDPLLNAISGHSIVPEIALGAAYFSDNYFLSLSVKQFLASHYYALLDKIEGSDTDQGSDTDDGNTTPNKVPESKSHRDMHTYFAAGFLYSLPDVDFWEAAPEIVITYVPSQPIIVDYLLKIFFERDFWIGGAFRTDNTIIAMAGCRLRSFLSFSYSYDLNLFSSAHGFNSGAHEIVLGFQIPYEAKVQCPKFVW